MLVDSEGQVFRQGRTQVAHLSSTMSGSSDVRLQRKTKGWNYTSSLSSLTYLVINAIINVRGGPQFLSVWISPSDFST